MIRNYFKIAWRNLVKNKTFSFINIMGLGLALPVALMAIIQIVTYYEFDSFHAYKDQIVRVITDEKNKNNEVTNWASSPVNLGAYLKENLSGVEKSATLVRDFKWPLKSSLKYRDVNAIFTEQSFFEIFNFPLEKGTYPTEPNSVVLTNETSHWYFGDINPVGQILEHPELGAFKVVGVLKNFNKRKTQFNTDVFLPLAIITNKQASNQNWTSLNAHTFVKISSSQNDLEAKLSKVSTEINKLIGINSQKTLQFKPQFLSDISPAKQILENDPYIQDTRSIYINFAFQLILLLLAAINYINLTLARSMNRSKEVGVRKVIGATKTQLITQFLSESVLISYLALAVGLIILWLIKTYIHVSWLTWEIEHYGYLFLTFFVFSLVLGLAAGASPSLILSNYQPVEVLKGNMNPLGLGKMGMRKALIIFQFAVALIFMFFIGHAYHQTTYMATDNDNYQRENIVNIGLHSEKTREFANDLSKIKEIQHAGYTSLSFGNKPLYAYLKSAKGQDSLAAFYYATDRNFIEIMGLKIIAGENLTQTRAEQSSPLVVVNNTVVENLRLGSPSEAIGKSVMLNDTLNATIVGVVADFCNYDYEKKVEPIVFQYNPSRFQILTIKTTPKTERANFEQAVNNVWKSYHPYQEMSFSWLDTEMYDRYYPYEDMKFMGMESIVIVLIAIMGLVGLLIFSLEKRFKEIGVRKIMGANAKDLIFLLSKDFIKLLGIASLIASPFGIAIGYYMNTYYVFNDGIGYGAMGILFLFIIVIALSVVATLTWKASNTNPIKTLKVE